MRNNFTSYFVQKLIEKYCNNVEVIIENNTTTEKIISFRHFSIFDFCKYCLDELEWMDIFEDEQEKEQINENCLELIFHYLIEYIKSNRDNLTYTKKWSAIYKKHIPDDYLLDQIEYLYTGV